LKRRRQIRVIQQMEAAECGVACLSMVLDYYGHARALPEIRQICGTSRDGNSALDLLTGARSLGLEGSGVSVPLKALRLLKKPAILHWDFNHFVILEAWRSDAMTIVDPASGRREVSLQEVSRSFSGVALLLSPGPAFEKRRRRSPGYGRYLVALKDQKRSLFYVLLASATQQVLAVSLPAANRVLIDHVIMPGRQEWLVPIFVILLGASLAQITLQRLRGLSQALLSSAIGLVLTRQMGERLLRLPLPFLESRSHGDLINRVHMQAELQNLLSSAVQALLDVFFVLCLIVLMISYDPMLGSISLLLTLLRIVVIRWFRRPLAQRHAAELVEKGREAGVLAESTAAPEMIQGFGVEAQITQRYANRVRQRAGWTIGSERFEVGLTRGMSVLGAAMQAVILYVGGCQVIEGHMTIGTFAGFLAIRAMLSGPVASLVALIESSIRLRGILERCADILDTPPVRDADSGPAVVEGRVELRDVSFRFGNGSPWVLKNVNLVIEPGEHVAIVGPSGEGKSTLGKLICGLLEPTQGRVLIDARDIHEYSRRELARLFGVVLQEPLILEGSVLEALTLRDHDCDWQTAFDAAQQACFHEVVLGLPDGYDSKLEAMGRNLSGGERQRLAIAQALLGRPRLLLLDEATCSLDNALEERVLDNIKRTGATIISIAHRPEVIAHATRTIQVRGGELRDAPDMPNAVPPSRTVPRPRPSSGEPAWR
jgi:ATP-binding cassette subfamily B protein